MLKLVMFLCVVQLAASSPADEDYLEHLSVEESFAKTMRDIAQDDYDRALAEQDRIEQMIKDGRVNTDLVRKQKKAAERVQEYKGEVLRATDDYRDILAIIAQAEEA